MGAGGWPKAITLQSAGPWKVDGSWLVRTCDQQPRLDNGWALQAPRMATSWAVTRAQEGPDLAWCCLIARFMSAQKQTFQVWLVDRRPWR